MHERQQFMLITYIQSTVKKERLVSYFWDPKAVTDQRL